MDASWSSPSVYPLIANRPRAGLAGPGTALAANSDHPPQYPPLPSISIQPGCPFADPSSANPLGECHCIIDVSSPASLERDFYAWLNHGSNGQPNFDRDLGSEQDLASSMRRDLSGGGGAAGGCVFSNFLNAPILAAADSVGGSGSSASSNASPTSASTITAHEWGSSSDFHLSTSSSSSASSRFLFPPTAAAAAATLVQHQGVSPLFPQLPTHQQQASHLFPSEMFLGGTTQTVGEVLAGQQQMAAAAGAKPRAKRKRTIDKGRGTNLYGRPYCPGRPLSMEERARIIHLFHAGMKVNAISKQLCISHGCVSKIITRFRETGLLQPSSHSECRRRKRQQVSATATAVVVKIEN